MDFVNPVSYAVTLIVVDSRSVLVQFIAAFVEWTNLLPF